MASKAPANGEVVKGPEGPLPVIVLPGLEGNPVAYELGPLQRRMAPYTDALIVFWWVVLGLVAANALRRLVQGYRTSR